MFFFFFSSRRRHTRWPRDWSSDVCSSDLVADAIAQYRAAIRIKPDFGEPHSNEIGRASCRERVEISGVAVSLKKKKMIKLKEVIKFLVSMQISITRMLTHNIN